jgi:transposase-like protein
MNNLIPRKKLSPDERRALCEQWKTSDLSQSEFCRQQGVALSSFYQWLSGRRLDNVRLPKKNIPAWAPLEIKNTQKNLEEPLSIEIVLPNNIMLKLSVAYSKINSVIEQLNHANTTVR